ncbi:hypothetical protein NliqN6_6449 [Naganishia liquefaciens]|uniref:Uncharacterized protein n=1 Tax=Naganishia liquefaciens TaxID=104408 RepID=A0A8H3TZP5_9TREE|nr:hypothetical protein NliqN6_6449 [Naganishia liquefaciens]
MAPSDISIHRTTSTSSLTREVSRGRSRARPIHLVRQALGIPHFAIAPGIVAEPSDRRILGGKDVPRPILSRLPVEMDKTGPLVKVPFGNEATDDSDEDDEIAPPLLRLSTPSSVFYTQSRLPALSSEHIPFWHALHRFGPQRQDYAAAFARLARTAPHPLAPNSSASGCLVMSNESYIQLVRSVFNYTAISLPATIPDHRYYCVLFRSTRHRSAPPESIRGLYAADRRAHEEAITSGGLLMYWYGVPNAAGENVATCAWTSREEAVRASRLEKHRAAAALAGRVYETYEVVRYVLNVKEGTVNVEAWK